MQSKSNAMFASCISYYNGTGQWHWSVIAVASFTALCAFKNPNKFLKVPLRGTFKNLFGFLSLNRLY